MILDDLEPVRDHSHQVAEARPLGEFGETCRVWRLRLRRTYAELGDVRVSGLEDVVFVAENPLYPPGPEEWRDFVFEALIKMEANLDAMEDRRWQENFLNLLTNRE